MNTSLLAVFDSIESFLATIADALEFDILMWVFLGIFGLLIITTLIRLRFTYEVRAIKSFKKINKYFIKKPYINESNLAEFNRLMKKIPYQLRDRWQYYMLNREGLPSGEMTLYHCVEQPIKTSNYKSTIVMLQYITNVCAVLCLILSFFAVGGSSVLTPLTFVRGLIIPAMFYILCQFYIYFLNMKFNVNSVDLYEYYLSFIRNLDKASASIPDYVDYELLFTDKEIRDGIPVLREYLEKRALLDKIAREKAKKNESERENFDFSNLGIDGSLLVERAMTTSQDYINNRNRLKEEIAKLETQKDSYNEQYVSVEKDSQKKLQAIKENLARLQTQLEGSASKIEANYIKKQQDTEKSKRAEIEKNLEDLNVKYAQQMQFLEDEINSRKKEIEEDKKSVTEQMDAEFETYKEKVYTILRNEIDKNDADSLKVTRAELDDTRDKLASETQEKENLLLTLDIRQQQIDTMQSSINALNDKIAKLTSRDKKNIAKMYDENVELKQRVAELEAQLQQPVQAEQVNQADAEGEDEDVVYYDKDGNVVDFSQYYDENGYFKEFPKVYDKDGNYYDFADYYDKYGNPLNTEESEGDEGAQVVAENTEEQPQQDVEQEQPEESQEQQEQEPQESQEVEQAQEVAPTEQVEQEPQEVENIGENGADIELQGKPNTEEQAQVVEEQEQLQPVEPEEQEQFSEPQAQEQPTEPEEDVLSGEPQDVVENFDDDTDGNDIVYYDKDGNVVDFEQYYDEDGRFKEFPKVYDKDGNYYDFADYYDRDGNLLDAQDLDEIEQPSEGEIQEPTTQSAQEQPLAEAQNELVVNVQDEQPAVESAQPVESAQVVATEEPKRKRGRPRKVQTEEGEAKKTPAKRKATTTKSGSKKTGSKSGTKAKGTGAKKSTGKTTKGETAKKSTTAKKSSATKKPATKSATKSTTKSATKKPATKKKADEDLDKLSGQIDSENAKLEQKQADLKNKITQTLSELQETPTVDRDLEDIKAIIKTLKEQASEVNKKDSGLSESEQKKINKQINKSLSELLMIMANKSKK